MKKLLIIFLILSACSGYKKLNGNSKKSSLIKYQVYKIDSVGAYYLIYAKKQVEDTLYKVISKKSFTPTKKYQKIEIGKKYEFSLRTAIPNINVGGQIIDSHNPNVRCYLFEGSTEICLEDYIYDLYFANNVKGLYIERDTL